MHTVKRLREFTSQQSKGLGLFDSNARGTCLPNLMGRSAVEQGMNDFISGFKLKGSSSLELKTDLCMLWNEVITLYTDPTTLAVTVKQKRQRITVMTRM